jgi:HK97 family phage major capsid protein
VETLGVKQVVANTGMYFMNRETSITLYNMKDGDGNRLWANSLINGQPPTFYGKPVIILDGMDGIETGKLPILFGSLRGYEIWDRARATIQPLTEKFATTGTCLTPNVRRVTSSDTTEPVFAVFRFILAGIPGRIPWRLRDLG